MNPTRWWALALTAALLGGVAPRAAAQSACDSECREARQDARHELEKAMKEVRAALAAHEQATAEMARANTPEKREQVARAQRDLRSAMRRLDMLTARLAQLEVERGRAPSAVRVRSAPTIRARVQQERRGYMGVNLSTSGSIKEINGETLWQLDRYPIIESVEPGSPAERAGLLSGDVLLSLDGKDMTAKDFSLTKVLVPGKRIDVRVRRDGEPKRLALVVDEIPVRRIVIGKIPAGTPDAEEIVVVPLPPNLSIAPTPATPEMPALAPMPPMPPMVVGWTDEANMALAGANLVQVTGDLRETFGVERGVLVLQVGSGTPASRAGLKAGDVIVSAAGARIRTPHDVQMALERASERRAVELGIVRKKERRTVTLRW